MLIPLVILSSLSGSTLDTVRLPLEIQLTFSFF